MAVSQGTQISDRLCPWAVHSTDRIQTETVPARLPNPGWLRACSNVCFEGRPQAVRGEQLHQESVGPDCEHRLRPD
jgi:hypothetical protein